MISSILRLTVYPALIFGFIVTSITLTFAAAIATPISLSILFLCWVSAHFRPVTIIIYACTVEYISVIVKIILSRLHLRRDDSASSSSPSSPAAVAAAARRSRPSSRRSSFGQQQSPFFQHKKSSSYSTIPSHNRDFEGIGGWRDQGDEDEEQLWMQLNNRLEIPRRPSLGSSGSPVLARSPAALMRVHKKAGSSRSGTASPEEYFGHAPHSTLGGGGAALGVRLVQHSRQGSESSLKSLRRHDAG